MDLPSDILEQIFQYQHILVAHIFDHTRSHTTSLGQGLEAILPNRLVCKYWARIVDDMDETVLEKQLKKLVPI